MQAQPLMLPEGDFALGMRTIAIDAQTVFTCGDFAAGMRTRPPALAIGTFATGQATTSASTVRGHFATGQDGRSRQTQSPHPRLHRHEHPQSTIRDPAVDAGVS
jgi:hypothetical protein